MVLCKPLSTATHHGLNSWMPERIYAQCFFFVFCFFDYRKAFDTVPHWPLLEKLVALKLNRHVIQWIADYLTARTQQVVVDGETSEVADVLSGVPHAGLCPGPPSISNLHSIWWNGHHFLSLNEWCLRTVHSFTDLFPVQVISSLSRTILPIVDC